MYACAKCVGFINELEQVANSDLTTLFMMDPNERAHRLAELQSLLESCLSHGLEKDRLAAQTYELV